MFLGGSHHNPPIEELAVQFRVLYTCHQEACLWFMNKQILWISFSASSGVGSHHGEYYNLHLHTKINILPQTWEAIYSCEILGLGSTLHFTISEIHYHFHLTSLHEATQLMIINFTRSSGSSMLTAIFMSVSTSSGIVFHIATCCVSNQILQKWNATRVRERKDHVLHAKQYKVISEAQSDANCSVKLLFNLQQSTHSIRLSSSKC